MIVFPTCFDPKRAHGTRRRDDHLNVIVAIDRAAMHRPVGEKRDVRRRLRSANRRAWHPGESFAEILVKAETAAAEATAECLVVRTETMPWPHSDLLASIGVTGSVRAQWSCQ